ncbi:MAG: antibiotic biosynthesis monooxygenase family protein [Actinomycetaceae bacterium]|nr:antibiotic biosynthesis monooxygenase family protein [Actinomycetaceae bacterium]
MSVIVTNEITVPSERGEIVAKKFEENARGLDTRDGFEGFELCRPTSPEDDRWLVITRWRDEAAYHAWRDSRHYTHSHPQTGADGRKPATAKGVDANSIVRHYDVALSVNGSMEN